MRPSFTEVNYFRVILFNGALGAPGEPKVFPATLKQQSGKLEILCKKNQSALVGGYVNDRCWFTCHVVNLFLTHVILGNVIFFTSPYYGAI